MRAAKLSERPAFSLMKQTDIQKIYHLQMPRWLFSDPRYADMSLDAKVAYTFLLNRFQLSRKKGWVNEQGEVFVIFPRKAMASELRICEQRVSAAFHKLVEKRLIWEQRCGRGEANQIYLAQVYPIDDPDYSCEPFTRERLSAAECDSRTAGFEVLDEAEPQNLRLKNCKNGGSRTADTEVQEPQNSLPSYIDKSHIEESYMEVSPSVSGGLTDEAELNEILNGCELSTFSPELARIFENAIARLYYSDSFRIGNATLPQSRVRSQLRQLDMMILQDAQRKLQNNTTRSIRNSTQYAMAVLFNCITESDCDLEIDPYLNSIRASPAEGR